MNVLKTVQKFTWRNSTGLISSPASGALNLRGKRPRQTALSVPAIDSVVELLTFELARHVPTTSAEVLFGIAFDFSGCIGCMSFHDHDAVLVAATAVPC
jgi:hypothetical protein